MKGADVNRYVSMLVMEVCLLGCTGKPVQSGSAKESAEATGGVAIVLDNLMVDEKAIQLRYHITNRSNDSSWICASMDSAGGTHFDAYLAEDNETLVIRRRLDVSKGIAREHPMGCYIRLPSAETRTELMSMTLPVVPRTVLWGFGLPRPPTRTARLVLEIGYYLGDLPGMVMEILDDSKPMTESRFGVDLDGRAAVRKWIGGTRHFIMQNEGLRDRSEEVMIPYTRQALKGEHILRLAVDAPSIPYARENWHDRALPDLTACTRMEIQFQPSALEFLFPHADQQDLLDPTEKEYLRSLDKHVVRDPKFLKAFADEVNLGLDDAFMNERAVAHLICYRDEERFLSLSVGCDASILTQSGQLFRYPPRYYAKPPGTHNVKYPGNLQGLRPITPEIQAMDLRIECARHLKDLWHRLRSFQRITGRSAARLPGDNDAMYPPSTQWCDQILKAYERLTTRKGKPTPIWTCPSAGKGDCYYAMNPNCKTDSPADTVLLFETKAGWNQHGGPELFTFDNHDPKGGLVLLNDGTVKFIRTEEELKQLRWK